MERLKLLLMVFVRVTTSVVFATAVYITVFWPQVSLGVEILWEILLISFFTSLGVFFYPEEDVSSKTIVVRVILHYIYCNIVVLGSGIWFGWFYVDDLAMVLGMVAAIAVVFFGVSEVIWNRTKKTAILMNERLKGYQQDRMADAEEMEMGKKPGYKAKRTYKVEGNVKNDVN